jgi:acetyl-CoA synthetase
MESVVKNFNEYTEAYKRSIEDPENFWAEIADEFVWRKKWNEVLEWDFNNPSVKWFLGAKLNITENCLDRHLDTRGDKTAIIWEPNDPNESPIYLSYKELHKEVCKAANMLKNNGVGKGDRVCLYMPMVPELAISVLACARVGAIHSVVFAGFSSNSLADRINDAKCKMVLTSDGSFRGDKVINLKEIVDQALKSCDSIDRVVVVKRTGGKVNMVQERDAWWHDEIIKVDEDCEVEIMDAEDELFILYTSGSTGKPKGMVHTCGGYMVYADYSFRNVFQYEEEDIYWCTADIGWVTGHSYIVYGPLSAGATTVMFEGVPTYPDAGRFWEVVEKYKVNIFYTAPTAIRALATCDIGLVEKYDLSSLKVLGTVGEPINEEAWNWYNQNIGKGNAPIVDTWWQTETGGIVISPLAGVTEIIPTYATLPLPGIQPALLDEYGNELTEMEAEGNLCIKFPWPSIARTVYGNHTRYVDTYFSTYEGMYFSGDGCKRDAKGNYRITGRVDDILIVSGHNLGTAEIENVIDEHPMVSEAAVVGAPHDIKGNAVVAFVSLKEEVSDEEELKQELIQLVRDEIGPIAKPEKIYMTKDLPKTRSGKIMRRILRKIAEGKHDELGDVSTLLNPDVVKSLISLSSK